MKFVTAGLTLSIDNYPITSKETEEMKRILYHEALGSLI